MEMLMAPPIKPVRRVVTGNDANGESYVLYDSAAPNVNPGAIRPGTCMTDVWVYPSCPVELAGTRDDGRLKFNFEPPHAGGHLRVVQSPPKPPGYDPAAGTRVVRTRFRRRTTSRKPSITASCLKANAC
jgi:hypothetical protein